ncbi:MAG: rhodanese-like domain-containing protein [Robiginitomaculum sp.]
MAIKRVIVSVIVALALTAPALAQDNAALTKTHIRLVKKYDDVAHISPQDYAALPTGSAAQTAVLFDIRGEQEFSVSHMPGAIHIDPKIKPADFIAQYGERLRGKTVVLYCSVGARSSKLANRVQDDLRALGSGPVYNLEGGIFKWHNQGRALEINGAPTRYIHPYNRRWGRMVNDQSAAQMRPQAEP